MTRASHKISDQTRNWFFERDARAYSALSDFSTEAARRCGAGPDAEDLAQALLLDLTLKRDAGMLRLHSTAEFEGYLVISLRRRHISLWRRHGQRRAEGEVDSVASAVDAPDAALDRREHLELYVQIMHHALEQAGVVAATRSVVRRIFDRYVLCRDIESVLMESRLLGPDATSEQRVQERNNENRRQSRARATLTDALHELLRATEASTAMCWLNAGSRRIPFNTEDVRHALRLAMSLGRCEKAAHTAPKDEQ
jgi:hypothetical protein